MFIRKKDLRHLINRIEDLEKVCFKDMNMYSIGRETIELKEDVGKKGYYIIPGKGYLDEGIEKYIEPTGIFWRLENIEKKLKIQCVEKCTEILPHYKLITK